MKQLIAGIIFVLILVYAYPVIFGPSQVIEAVDIFTEDESVVLQIDFTVPVRYEDHYPEQTGEILQIKCRLVSLAGVNKKEIVSIPGLRPELVKQISLVNISFEGGVEGGPLLTMLFSKPVKFEVREDPQLKSMFVVFSKASLKNANAGKTKS